MKILVTLFDIQDYGGIISGTELLVRGMRELGHQCDFVILRPNDQPPYTRKDTGPSGSYPSIIGTEVNTLSGWYGVRVMSYGSRHRIKEYHRYAERYDLIIHEIPCPKPDKKGFWAKVYDVEVNQIIIVHDAHYRDMYPHLALIARHITAVTCTNHAGYAALEWLDLPRAFIGAPHELLDWKEMIRWSGRRKQAVAAHVWKGWKRMDTVVRAIPHMKKGTIITGGDGIEGRYMRSKDKCKPKYEGIWNRAIRAGMDYRGLMTHDELFELYKRSRVMLDLSWSKKFYNLGNHFNRSLIEGYNCGLVPVCVGINMTDVGHVQTKLWIPGVNYINVPYLAPPEEVAYIVDCALSMKEVDAMEIIDNGRKILKRHFDYRKYAKSMLTLAEGRPAGIYPKLESGAPPSGFYEFAKKFVKEKAK